MTSISTFRRQSSRLGNTGEGDRGTGQMSSSPAGSQADEGHCLVPRQVQESHFKHSAGGRLVPERFFSPDLLCCTPCPRKGMTDFREKPLIFMCLCSELQRGTRCRTGLWSSYSHEHCEQSHAASTRDAEQDCQTSLPTISHTRKTTVGSLL